MISPFADEIKNYPYFLDLHAYDALYFNAYSLQFRARGTQAKIIQAAPMIDDD